MKTALLAEDDPVCQTYLHDALPLLGWQCTVVETCAAAVQAAIAQRFDALILDLNLPDGQGIDALRQIRNHDAHASVDSPALALTATTDPHLHARLRDLGFDAVGLKPLTLARLRELLHGLDSGPAATAPDSAVVPGQGGPDTSLPDWDDAASQFSHQPANLGALRHLLLRDLPAQQRLILAEPRSDAAAQCLHRLRAATGFCGAVRLAHAVARLERHPDTEALDDFARACEALLQGPMP